MPVSSAQGYIIEAYHRQTKNGLRIFASGRLQDGRSFGLIHAWRPGLYLRSSDQAHAQTLLKRLADCQIAVTQAHSMQQEALVEVSFDTLRSWHQARDLIQDAGLPSWGADYSPTYAWMLQHDLRGPVQISGHWQTGRLVDQVVINPDLKPVQAAPSLRVLSLDIETDPQASQITAISLTADWLGPVHADAAKQRHLPDCVLLPGSPQADDASFIEACNDERSMLQRFLQLLRQADPDIITGWNVIDFDCRVIIERCQALGITCSMGRSDEAARYSAGERFGTSRCLVHGRRVCDGMQLVRQSLHRFDDYRLDTVAQQVLGRGKVDLQAFAHSDNRAETISTAMQEDRQTFARYCLDDAKLVLQILEKENLLPLTIARAGLTGLPLDRAWGSVGAFEYLYGCGLHKRQVIPRSLGECEVEVGGAPGGTVLPSQLGLHKHILVFDFRSLYPSIIRTFNIDPLTRLQAQQASASAETIDTPTGIPFARQRGILPEMLDVFFDRRAKAKEAGDELASYTYKIVMNSFYGVLGTQHCRYAHAELASSITGTAAHLLFWCRDLLEEWGYTVLYGDTDSVFVDAHLSDAQTPTEIQTFAQALAQRINHELGQYIQQTWQLESRLELEFEKHYRRLLLPPTRHDDQVGRAKGYAGYLQQDDGSCSVDIVGLEAVRRDWTDFAHQFQRDLLQLVFAGQDGTQIEAMIRQRISALLSGQHNHELIYKRALRKPVESYTKTTPPHVRAARLAGKNRGVIKYVMTIHGAQPADQQQAPIDTDHYIEKQLRPIVQAVAPFCGVDTNRAISGEQSFL